MAPEDLLRAMFDRAVEVADPMRSLAAVLPEKPEGRIVVVGAGKASARMAEAVEAAWGPCDGLVITRYGYGRPCQGIEIVEAAHPVPDRAGQQATTRMLDLLQGLDQECFVLALISGGASALLVAPAGDISLAEKQELNEALLASGAPIGEMNVVRKALSEVKGGRLAAAAHPAKMLSLLISDVPGDDPRLIGSGPTVGDGRGAAEAKVILQRYQIDPVATVKAVLDAPRESVAEDDPRLAQAETKIFAAPAQSLEAAAELARGEGIEVDILGDAIEGEARDVAAVQAELARERQDTISRPLLLLSGGELTVTRRGNGVGGPNAEFALALALALDGAEGISAIACDTDGVDGAAEVAGAMVTPKSLVGRRAEAEDALTENDAHGFWQRAGGQVVTGPTLTNVNDFRAILIEPRRR